MKTNLLVDLGIFAAFLIAFEPGATGIPIHEWLSLAFAGTIVLHLLLHWNWITSLTVDYFKKLLHASRLDYVVDWLLFAAFTVVMLSGLIISESVLATLGIHLPRSPVWRGLHSVSADLMLVLVGLHFALHWSWTVNAFARIFVQPVHHILRRLPFKPAQVAARATPNAGSVRGNDRPTGD